MYSLEPLTQLSTLAAFSKFYSVIPESVLISGRVTVNGPHPQHFNQNRNSRVIHVFRYGGCYMTRRSHALVSGIRQ